MANLPTLAEMITGDWIGESYSQIVIAHTRRNLVIVPHCNHKFTPDLAQGTKVSISVLSEPSTGNVTAGTELTAQNCVGTPTSITVDQWKGVRVEESEMQTVQDHIDYLGKAAQSCGYAIAKVLDLAMSAYFSGLGGYTSSAYGADGQTFTDDIFIYLVETLDESDVPPEGRVLIGDPSMRADLLKIDKFVRNDYVKGGVIATGQFGMLYDTKVLLTNNLTAATTGNYGVLMHPDAIGCVIQKNPYSQRIVDQLEHQIVYQVKIIYGSAELRDTFGVPFFTRKT
jgi:hypothetical protein